jgi:hypothetical protein
MNPDCHYGMEQMQLDDDLSTSLERTSPVLHIPDQAIQRVCNLLDGLIDEENPNDHSLEMLFFTVEHTLKNYWP